jgi:aspartate 1-decarboxylase
MIKIVRAKLHGLRVTDANLDYHGSVTLDPEWCAAVHIYPLEFVHIWNKTNGARLTTYVIFGEPGSRCCVLNGAAAHLCRQGDEVIIAAFEYVDSGALYQQHPKILVFGEGNAIIDEMTYEVTPGDHGAWDFRTRGKDGEVRNVPIPVKKG